MIIEMRTYKTKPGCRPRFLEIFRSKSIPAHAEIGMKILGQGDMRSRPDEAIRFALGTGVLDAFTIGAENDGEQADLIKRIAAA